MWVVANWPRTRRGLVVEPPRRLVTVWLRATKAASGRGTSTQVVSVTAVIFDPAMMPDPVPGHSVPGMHLWGWMDPLELTWLAEQAAHMGTVVEVGSLHGRSSYALATACPGLVYCIDPWLDGAWESWTVSVGQVCPNARAIRGYSPAAGDGVPDPVDMVFLDGAHDRDSVVADIDYWLSRTTTLLCGHDYLHEDYPDVRIVVDELLPDATLIPGTSIWAKWMM